MRNILQRIHLVVSAHFNPVYYVLKKDIKTILDVGCGNGVNTKLLKIRLPELVATGIDIYPPSIEYAKGSRVFKKVIKKDLSKSWSNSNKFDVVICLQLIEHLNEEVAIKLIDRLEKTSQKQIIFTTPIGSLDQGEVEGNVWQSHKSKFTPEFFIKRGYQTKNLGRRFFSSQEGIQSKDADWLVKAILLFIDVLLTPVYWIAPFLADHYFIAWKTYEE